MKRAFLSLSVAFLLAGCVAPDAGISASQKVGPGHREVDGLGATLMFRDVCGQSAPSFNKAADTLKSLPFTQHPQTGTYYHNTLNLSIKVTPGRCSMVFKSSVDPMELGIALAVGLGSVGGSNNIAIDPDSGFTQTKGPRGTTMTYQAADGKMHHVVLGAP